MEGQMPRKDRSGAKQDERANKAQFDEIVLDLNREALSHTLSGEELTLIDLGRVDPMKSSEL
jgi:hypothetical protein